ncbi:nicotianamine aminotransferase 1-like [Euphorbia lathyris]|uniref:nicotianamine aminotransferase 1-like n=1 Tax=Euphorbia lathyris TaxID=212925 RepID=UPI0033135334
MKYMLILHLGVTHLCQWECLVQLCLSLPLAPYQRDGSFLVGDLAWLAATDPNGILQKSGGAVPQILEKTGKDFFVRNINILREAADVCYDRIQDIPCMTFPTKPQGSMFIMTKLDLSQLESIKDDFDFCLKLAKEESVIVLPGFCLGTKNWLRITFAVDPSSLEVGLGRLKAFCERHAKHL